MRSSSTSSTSSILEEMRSAPAPEFLEILTASQYLAKIAKAREKIKMEKEKQREWERQQKREQVRERENERMRKKEDGISAMKLEMTLYDELRKQAMLIETALPMDIVPRKRRYDGLESRDATPEMSPVESPNGSPKKSSFMPGV